jgi:hypothetical protein
MRFNLGCPARGKFAVRGRKQFLIGDVRLFSQHRLTARPRE